MRDEHGCEFCADTGFEWRDYWSEDAIECRDGCPVTVRRPVNFRTRADRFVDALKRDDSGAST